MYIYIHVYIYMYIYGTNQLSCIIGKTCGPTSVNVFFYKHVFASVYKCAYTQKQLCEIACALYLAFD